MGTTSSTSKNKSSGGLVGGPPQTRTSVAKTTTSTQKPSPAKFAKPGPVGRKAQPKLTQEEIDDRRKRFAAAAEARTKAWDERVQKQRIKREAALGNTAPPPSTSPAPAAAPSEPHTLIDGFDPYKTTFMSSSNARAVISSGVPSSSGPRTQQSFDDPDAMNNARKELLAAMATSDSRRLEAAITRAKPFEVPEVDEAAQLLDALQVDDPEAEEEDASDGVVEVAVARLLSASAPAAEIDIAVQTVAKMVANLLAQPHEAKFRKIKLSNPVVQSKLVNVANGAALGVLEAVGFQRTVLEGEEHLCVPDPDTLEPEIVQAAKARCSRVAVLLKSKATSA